MRWHHGALVGLGLWLAVSPWVLGFSALNLALWNSIAVGVVVVLLAWWSATTPEA